MLLIKVIAAELRGKPQEVIYLPGQTPKVYTVEGLKAVKSLLFGLLKKNADIIWLYGLAENKEIMNLLKERLMNSFHLERIKKRLNSIFYFINSR
jgi:hypothetical protein